MNEAVASLIEDELTSDPDLSSRELQEKAAEVDESVLDLTGRQFHAKYTLQVRRRLKQESRSPTTDELRLSAGEQDPALELLIAGYNERRSDLNRALEEAFTRALRADSVEQINRLLRMVENEIARLRSLQQEG